MARGKLEPISNANGSHYFRIDESDIELLTGLYIKVEASFEPEADKIYDFVIGLNQDGEKIATRIIDAYERTKKKKPEHAAP